MVSQNNIATAGMGGISAAYTSDQALNSVNPATYTALRYVKLYGGSNGALITYDIGVNITTASLRSANPVSSYKSNYFIPSYIMMGVPLSSKAQTKGRNAALIFGFRPASKINYSISNNSRNGVDSLQSLYQGDGGLYQVFAGLAKRWGNLSLGVNGGYEFGRKQVDTRILFNNDSVSYFSSLTSGTTEFWGYFVQPGITYNLKLRETENKQ
ncbi:MAG TPA: hypothetical protein PL045_03760, partial [Chitinophagaceae bacterium]|nr:hypothetical protein [Chitinophagaceae bacterium]